MAMTFQAFFVVSLVAMLSGIAMAFMPVSGGASTHVTITGNAILGKIGEVCRAIAESEGKDFNPTGSSAEELLRACLGTTNGEITAATFRTALNQIYMQNGLVDQDLANSPAHHTNNEAFSQARSLIAEGTAAIKANIRMENFQAARETLGRICHTLQDFYSHSNWVELGNRSPYINMIRPELPIENVADIDTPTCRDCDSDTCSNPLLPDILSQKKLTSGYMGILSNTKPKGKCSHGGNSDLTSSQVPRGGISKDVRRADNAALHDAAVTVATQATSDLLEDIRGAAGNKDFLRLMGIARSSVLCFVIDTTGSMSDDIAEAKRVANNIIDGKKGTVDEPSEYILVQFNDPKFGPLIRTTDPDKMKAHISALSANGGGDIPEMCLSALQLALTGAPPSSQIYIFTDAPAKDMSLERTIISLIRSTKSTVNIFMTPKKRTSKYALPMTRADFSIYYDLALASGGQAIEVTKSNLPQATEIIMDSSTSALVTLLQRSRNPFKADTFRFLLEEAISNVTMYITGTSMVFTLKNPQGVIQTSSQTNGPLGAIQTVGNLKRVTLNSYNQTGLWEIQIISGNAYSVKVTGQSSIAFVYDFVETFEGPHPGYRVITGRPPAGLPTKLLLTLTGSNGPKSLKVTEAVLVEVSGSGMSNGSVEDMGDGNFLMSVKSAPTEEFVVLIKGEDLSTSSQFQRQSTTQMAVTPVSIKLMVESSMEPGKSRDVPFTLSSGKAKTKFRISTRNDKDYTMKYPSRLDSGDSTEAKGILTITAPKTASSGTDITLTIDVEVEGTSNSNYAVLRISVMKKVTDFIPPTCTLILVNNSCPANCKGAFWEATFRITDGNGTGVASIKEQQGNIDLSITNVTDHGGITVVEDYNRISCCTPEIKLSVTDQEGNVGFCFHSIRPPTTTSMPSTTLNHSPSLGQATTMWLCLVLASVSVYLNVFSIYPSH